MKGIADTLAKLSLQNDLLVIFTDCDREGEYIGEEIKLVCKRSNPSIVVKRAIFSGFTRTELLNAIRNLRDLSQPVIDSVKARTELDLRTGASLTRIQTISLRSSNEKTVISYGPCQFPTLGFIVEQYIKSTCFIPESFFTIELSVISFEEPLKWERGSLFDETFVILIESELRLFKKCIVSSIDNRDRLK
jgi:DNA topoisomerase-3